MLRPKKKITKRQLKEDALVTSYAKVRSFYDEHRRTISISITAAAVVIIALVVYVKNRQENSDAALARLGAIQTYFDSGQYQLALAGVPERNIPGLAAIVDEFGGSPGGEIARFYLANVYYKLGEYDQALSQFEEFSAPNAILEASRLSGIAACHEALGRYAEAAEQYERATAADKEGVLAAENLNNAARNYALAGDRERAIQIYRRLKKDFPTSSFGRDADRSIAELSV
jgi:tetratricopeptide (TPR) repeat protein